MRIFIVLAKAKSGKWTGMHGLHRGAAERIILAYEKAGTHAVGPFVDLVFDEARALNAVALAVEIANAVEAKPSPHVRRCLTCGAPEQIDDSMGVRLSNLSEHLQLCVKCINVEMKKAHC